MPRSALIQVDPIGSKARGVIGTFGNDEKDKQPQASPNPTASPTASPTTQPNASPSPEAKAAPEAKR
jgi:hypothetical protein